MANGSHKAGGELPTGVYFGVGEVTLRAIGTHATPTQEAMDYLRGLLHAKGLGYVVALVSLHKLWYVGIGLTRETLRDCLRLLVGKSDALLIEMAMRKVEAA